MTVDEAPLAPRQPRRQDVEALIGLLAVLEGSSVVRNGPPRLRVTTSFPSGWCI